MMGIDLNLLRVFEILYEEGNVTRAAARLCLTQSAVSHALARLRDVLDDPLFVRISSGLQPTERARQLAPRLRAALAEIRSLVVTPAFDPAATSRRFTISASSYFCDLIVRLIVLARKAAPNLSLQIVNIDANLAQALDQQQVDVALGGFARVPARFRSETLFRDDLVWAIGAHHPLAERPFDHSALLASPSLSIVPTAAADRSRERPARDDILRHANLETGDAADPSPLAKPAPTPVTVYDVPTAIAVAAATDMVALVPRRYAEACASSAQIRIVDLPPSRAETFDLAMLWHSRADEDPGSLWLRALIREAVKLHFDAARPRASANGGAASGGAGMKAKKAPANGAGRRGAVVRRALGIKSR